MEQAVPLEEAADKLKGLRERLEQSRDSARNKRERGPGLCDSSVRIMAMRPVEHRQLERIAGPHPRGKRITIWQFQRKLGLQGEIADLERAYHDDRQAAA